MNEKNFFFTFDKIDDKFIEEAANAAEKASAQLRFDASLSIKPKKLFFVAAGIAACFALIFGISMTAGGNSGMDITLAPLNTAAETTAEITTETEPQTDTSAVTFSHPYEWSENGFVIPDNWLPIMKNDEAYENFDRLMTQTQEGKNTAEIILNLVNRNIIAVDIFYGHEPAFTLDYKVEEEGLGKVNPFTGETNVYTVKSDYFNSLEEIEAIMNKVYTADLARERLYGEDRQLFFEKDNSLYADLNCMYAWSVTSFTDDSYIEIISSDDNECFFKYHFILWDYFDYENNDSEESYPHRNEITIRAIKENGEWRLCSPVFNNIYLDYRKGSDSADFVTEIEKIVAEADRAEDVIAAIRKYDIEKRVRKVRIHASREDFVEDGSYITAGDFTSGMYIYVAYDENSYLEMTK